MEKRKDTPDSLIFDMDGTLWDAVETYAIAWNKYFEKHQIKAHLTKQDLDSYMGFEQSAYLKAILPQFNAKERDKMYEKVINIQYQLIDEIGGYIYNGVIDGLKSLSKKYKLFIVSNCPKYTIRHFVKWAKIEEYITETLAHGENFKPKYENIQYLIRKHDLKHPVYIGDTNSDAKQSQMAEVPFIFMEYGFGETNNYHLKFKSFSNFSNYYLKFYN